MPSIFDLSDPMEEICTLSSPAPEKNHSSFKLTTVSDKARFKGKE
jgi:hypothetical protein